MTNRSIQPNQNPLPQALLVLAAAAENQRQEVASEYLLLCWMLGDVGASHVGERLGDQPVIYTDPTGLSYDPVHGTYGTGETLDDDQKNGTGGLQTDGGNADSVNNGYNAAYSMAVAQHEYDPKPAPKAAPQALAVNAPLSDMNTKLSGATVSLGLGTTLSLTGTFSDLAAERALMDLQTNMAKAVSKSAAGLGVVISVIDVMDAMTSAGGFEKGVRMATINIAATGIGTLAGVGAQAGISFVTAGGGTALAPVIIGGASGLATFGSYSLLSAWFGQ